MATIDWLGHASFRIRNERSDLTIYIDPWKLKGTPAKADLILLSHTHHDHFSPEDISKVCTDSTLILASEDCASQVEGNVQVLRPEETIETHGVTIRALPAYNVGKPFHPRENGWLGFLIIADGETIYFAGDTDQIPEMKSLGRIDVALLPVGGRYTMDPAEAAEAARVIRPGRCVPYHYGEIVGSPENAEEFKKACEFPVEILTPV